MKKSSLFLFSAILFLSVSITYGQIKVSTAGKVTIGETYDASYPLHVIGDSYITGNAGIGATPSSSYKLSVTGNTYLNGNIGIGKTPSSYYDIYTGSAYVSGSTSSVNFKVLGRSYFSGAYTTIEIGTATSQYEQAIFPDVDYCSTIGKTDKGFGNMYSYAYTTKSDKRLKENISELTNALELINQLSGVKYDLKKEVVFNDSIPYNEEQIAKLEKERTGILGFIAQDVEKVLPSAVSHDDKSDSYSMEYDRIIPLLVNGIKEQQAIIETMQTEMLEMKSGSLKSLALSGDLDLEVSNQCLLHQNEPNPFGETTSIKYSLPEGTTNADIIIYDMTGKQLKRIPITQDGESSIQVRGGEMDAGMYMYSMIVENQLVDTKQMIITE